MIPQFIQDIGRKYRIGWCDSDAEQLARELARFDRAIDHLPRDYQAALLALFVRATFKLSGNDEPDLPERFRVYLESLPVMD